jgi:malate permease and related proteins
VSHTNITLLTSLIIIFIGYFLKKYQIIKEAEGKVLSKVVLYVTFPALIFDTVSDLEIRYALVFLPFIPLTFCLLLFGICYFLFRSQPGTIKGVLFMAATGFNIGLFAYPIIEAIWGKEGLQYIAMYDLGNAFAVLGLSYSLGSAFSPQRTGGTRIDVGYILKKLTRSVPLISYIAALLFNVMGISFPFLVNNVIGAVARANMAMVLLLLGIYLNFRLDKTFTKQLSAMLIVKFGLALLTGITLFYVLPFDKLYRTIVLIALILPVGLTVIPFSDEFGYNTRFAGALANISILISFVLMWGLIMVFNLA